MYIMCNIVCQPFTTPMYINHVHQYHTIFHKMSSMECINHMPLLTCQPCASNKCHITHDIHLPRTKHHNHVSQPSSITTSVSSMSSNTSCTKVYAKQEKLMSTLAKYYHPQTYTIYECINISLKHVSPPIPSKCINHAPIPQQDELQSRCDLLHVCHKACANHIVGRFLQKVYQSCINYRSNYDSSMM
jgi:hypothetical protein